jgi:hypothetical protein
MANTTTVQQQQANPVRTVGSNYTTFNYAGKAIAYLEAIEDAGQQPLGQGVEFIHPLGYRYPTDVVTSRALDGGTMRLTIRELWHQEVWEQLAGLAGTTDIVQVFEKLASTNNYITCTKIITPPVGKPYGKVYHQCVIYGIPDGDTVNIGALSVAKTISIAYTHTTPL